MRKILACLSVLMVCFTGLFAVLRQLYDEQVYYNSIEETTMSEKIYPSETGLSLQEVLPQLEALSDSYAFSIVRTDENVIEEDKVITYKAGIYTDTYLSMWDLDLVQGTAGNADDVYVASFDTGDERQKGTLRNVFGNTNLIVETLSSYSEGKDLSADGVYTLSFNHGNRETILTELSSVFGMTVEELTNPSYVRSIAEPPYVVFIAGFLGIALVFVMVSALYPYIIMKQIGVYRLLGWDRISIWQKINAGILLMQLSAALFVGVFLKLLLPELPLSFFFSYAGMQLVVILATMVLSSSGMAVIRHNRIADILHGNIHGKAAGVICYVVKCAVFTALLFALPGLSDNIRRIGSYVQAISSFEEVRTDLTMTNYTFTDAQFSEYMSGSDAFTDQTGMMFKELESTADAEFSIIQQVDDEYLSFYEGWSGVPYQPIQQEKTVIQCNENYLEDYASWFGEDVHSYFAGSDLVYLVPQSIAEQSEGVVGSLWFLFDSDKPADWTYRIVTYQDNREQIFLPDRSSIDAGNLYAENPVFVCLHDQYMEDKYGFIAQSAVNNPIRIADTAENRAAIEQAIVNAGLENNQIIFGSAYEEGFIEYFDNLRSSVILMAGIVAVIMLVSVLSSWYIIRLLLIVKKKEMVVKKLIGFRWIDRYDRQLFFFVFIYLIGFARMVIGTDMTGIILYGFVVAIDIVVFALTLIRQERHGMVQVLKGEGTA